MLQDKSSLRARTYTNSIVAMRLRASDSTFLRFRSPTRPIAEGLGLSVRKPNIFHPVSGDAVEALSFEAVVVQESLVLLLKAAGGAMTC